MLLGKLTQYII